MLAAQHRLLSMAVAVSLLFHLVLLSLHFAPPDSTRLKPLEAGLDIILVHASDDKVPLKLPQRAIGQSGHGLKKRPGSHCNPGRFSDTRYARLSSAKLRRPRA